MFNLPPPQCYGPTERPWLLTFFVWGFYAIMTCLVAVGMLAFLAFYTAMMWYGGWEERAACIIVPILMIGGFVLWTENRD